MQPWNSIQSPIPVQHAEWCESVCIRAPLMNYSLVDMPHDTASGLPYNHQWFAVPSHVLTEPVDSLEQVGYVHVRWEGRRGREREERERERVKLRDSRREKSKQQLHQWKHASQYFEIWVSTQFLNKVGTPHKLKHSWGIDLASSLLRVFRYILFVQIDHSLQISLALISTSGDHLYNCRYHERPLLTPFSPSMYSNPPTIPKQNIKHSCLATSSANNTHHTYQLWNLMVHGSNLGLTNEKIDDQFDDVMILFSHWSKSRVFIQVNG